MNHVFVAASILAGMFVFDRFVISKQSSPIIERLKSDIGKINPEYLDIPIVESNTSYTKDKSVIYLCMRNPKTNQFYSYNTLMYVLLHEIAHTESVTYSTDKHNDEFVSNFDAILSNAIDLGIYDANTSLPPVYCGVAN